MKIDLENEERIRLLATKWNRPLTCKEKIRLSELTQIIRDRYPRVTQEDFDKIIQMAKELEEIEERRKNLMKASDEEE